MSITNSISNAEQWSSQESAVNGSFSHASADVDSQTVKRFAQLMKDGDERQDNSERTPDRDGNAKIPLQKSDDNGRTTPLSKNEKTDEATARFVSMPFAQVASLSRHPVETEQPDIAKCAELSSACQQVVESILATVPSVSGNRQEIRLMIKDSILPNTEIRLSHEGGNIRIAIVTESQESYGLLDREKTVLQDRLTERIADARIEVNVTYNDRDGDQQGRSRQRRNLYEEMHDRETTMP